jgi:murein DD-endopeptidase MepM/ murein hydrolase activator NlpD
MAAPLPRQFERNAPDPVRRAPLALAVVCAVLFAGAAILGFAIDPGARRGQPAGQPASQAEISPGADFGSVAWERPQRPEPPIAGAPETAQAPKAAEPHSAPTEAPVTAPAPEVAASAPAVALVPMDGALAGLTPRLKPVGRDGAASAAPATSLSSASASVVSLATRWLADERDQPPRFFFESDLVADRAPPPTLAVAYDSDLDSAPIDYVVVLEKRETFVDALRRAGVRAEDRNAAAAAFAKLHNMRALRPGQIFRLTIAEPRRTLFQTAAVKEEPPAHLLALEFRADAQKRISLTRAQDGQFLGHVAESALTTRIASINGRIDGSLYLSAKRQGAPDEVIAALAQMFAYDVDFQREIFGGDEFEAIFEVSYDESGKLVGGGEILYGRLKWRSRQKEKGYYRFETADSGQPDYFDASGESARRLLMKTPIDGARLSSGFGTRRHPILGYAKAHKGVDFAAPRGTPVMAAGDGVVERAGPYGTFGNFIRIRHAQGYKTAYAHLNAIKKGVRTGARVRQGEVVGYVGSTGRSTGPHLHYEVHFKDRAVNPQSLKIATGYELGGKELQRFKEQRDRIDAMRMPVEADASNVIADGEPDDKSL